MLDLVRVTLRTLLGKNKEKLPVAPLTLADQVLLPDGTNVAQALTEVRVIAAGASVLRVVPTLAERDALQDVQISWQVWVVDATADPTVGRGAAKYLYTGGINGLTAWIKTAEAESMDVALRWEALQDVPQVLRELGVDGEGLLTLGGLVVHDGKKDVVLLDEGQAVPNSVRVGGLALVRSTAGDDLVPCRVLHGTTEPLVPSLKGRTGDKGDKGDKGDTGDKGSIGAQGIQGVPGLQGLPGETGATGQPGAAGQNGRDGLDGAAGAAGSKGDKGDTGAPGAPGADGAPGAQGPQGATPPLNNTVTSGSTTEAATANAVRVAYDRGTEGINAATVAQQVAGSKAPGGFGLGGTSRGISNCNDAIGCGWCSGSNMVNAPSGGWYYIYTHEHCIADNWRYQIAVGYAGGEGIWYRQCCSGAWEAWTRLPSGITSSVTLWADHIAASATAVKIAYDNGFIAGGITSFSGGFGGSDGKRPIPRGKTVADEGWVLCDGTNGTPDLRDRFIVGAGASYGAGTAGGSVWHGHGLTGNVGATTLSVSQMPGHGHDYTWMSGGWWGGDGQFLHGGNTRSVGYTGASQAHTHGLDASVAAANGLPPYFALAYIMKW